MKKTFGGFDIEISEWTPALKMVTIIFATITVISSAMTLLWKYTVPGVLPIAMGVVALLLGIRESNVYFKDGKSKFTLTLEVVFTLLFVFLLCIGIAQIVTAMTKLAGL